MSIDETIIECLNYLDIHEFDKDLERFILIAREQTLLINHLETISKNIVDKLSSLEFDINEHLYEIDKNIDKLANISVSYEYKIIRIYVDTRHEIKTIETGIWVMKKTEVYSEDTYYFIIEENGIYKSRFYGKK